MDFKEMVNFINRNNISCDIFDDDKSHNMICNITTMLKKNTLHYLWSNYESPYFKCKKKDML